MAKVLAQAGGKVIATITVEDSPLWATYNPGNGLIYVPNDGSDSVTVIEQDNEVIDTVEVGDRPRDITHNPENGYVYVVNGGSGTLSVLNQDNEVIDTVNVGDFPCAVVYNPGNGLLYATRGGFTGKLENISVLNQDNEVIDTVNVGDFPFSITYNGGNKYLYVVNSWEPGAGTVSVIGTLIPPFSGILGSGNKINIQSQENSGDIVGGQPGFGGTYSDSPILQGQTTEQDSQLVS